MSLMHVGVQGALQRTNTGPASEANRQLGAERAAQDPAKLAKAIRIVKAALSSGRITLADITQESGKGADDVAA